MSDKYQDSMNQLQEYQDSVMTLAESARKTEAELVQSIKSMNSKIKDSTHKLQSSVQKVNTIGNIEKLIETVDTLERLSGVLETLHELDKTGKLNNIINAVSNKR